MLFDTFCKNIKQNHHFFMNMYENTRFWVENFENIRKQMQINDNR